MVQAEKVIGDRYTVEGVLARGGMADVYRARDRWSGRTVAVKVLRAGAADARRFETETQLLAYLQHHNLVRLLDAGQRAGVPYLVLELIEGTTLARRLRRGPLEAAEAQRTGRDIARALAYVHAQGVVHRDVKPSNILLARDGRAVLSDFGVARLGDGPQVTADGATIGTAAYLAPEQVGDAEVTPAADVYALGLVLIEALSGRPAFAGTPSELVATRLAGGPKIPPGLPGPWPALLGAMTARDPAARPDAAAVAARLRATSSAAHLAAETAETIESPARRRAGSSAAHLAAETAGTTETIEAQAREGEADTAELPVAAGTRPLEARRTEPLTLRSPALRPLLWLAGAFVALLVLAVFVASSDPGRDAGETAESSDRQASEGSAAEDPATTTTSTATTAPAPTTATTAPSLTPPAEASLADTCAALDAQKQAIDAERQQIDETYRDDPATRERLKAQLEAEKQAIDAQKQALGC